MNKKKWITIVIITLLILNLSPLAEGFSVKLRGKLALAAILSGVAFLTYKLVQHDKDVTETILAKLGRPEYIVQIDHGFDTWYIHQYKEKSYHFLNNRYIWRRPNNTFLEFLRRYRLGEDISLEKKMIKEVSTNMSPIDKTVLVNPNWSSSYQKHQQQVP